MEQGMPLQTEIVQPKLSVGEEQKTVRGTERE